MKIDIKYLADIEPIKQVEGSDMIDLRCSKDIFIPFGESYTIPLGVAMKLPEGYEAHLYPRSSTFKKYGLIMGNSVGIIDESYCGNNDEWKFPVYKAVSTTNDTTNYNGQYGIYIPKNTRIAQFRIVQKQPKIEFVMVDDLKNPDRGGFGSTGAF